MIQFHFLNGKTAGTSWVARRFPVRVGRSAGAHLHLSEDGVWEEHFEVRLEPGKGFVLLAAPEALTSVNGTGVRETVLRNGDIISIGALRLQFWLAETRQLGLGWREWLTWAGIGLVSLAQVALVYWLKP